MSQVVAWRETALSLAKSFHRTSELIEPEVVRYLDCDLPAQGSVIVMCSGGADSVATVLWAATASTLSNHRIGLFYCDHGQRSEAKSEAEFVRSLADALGFDFHLGAPSDTKDLNSEDDLRQLRENALAKVIESLDLPVVAILTGHQGDDVAENLLFRLARGSSLRGLSGMRPVQTRKGWPVRLRPLLRWRRDALRAALVEAGAQWCEDLSNKSGRYTRNRIRLSVLPALEEALPERTVAEGLIACQKELREIDAWVEAEASKWLRDFEAEGALPRSILLDAPIFVQKRILQKFIRNRSAGVEASDRMIERVLQASSGAVWQLDRDYSLVLAEGLYRVLSRLGDENPAEAFSDLELSLAERLELPSGGVLACDEVKLDADLKSRIIGGQFSPCEAVWIDQVSVPLSVRSWKPGDRYRPLGAPGTRKLQDCFVDAGIEQKLRGRLPIICDSEGEILWIPGLPPSHSHRLNSNTIQALRLTYKKS
jgi:tRNA(Ile)-lysidine synthase|tara:strand:- start:1025 stop:2473 length:1449 start_codon:yes stop_codon:yes gene_type:complete